MLKQETFVALCNAHRTDDLFALAVNQEPSLKIVESSTGFQYLFKVTDGGTVNSRTFENRRDAIRGALWAFTIADKKSKA